MFNKVSKNKKQKNNNKKKQKTKGMLSGNKLKANMFCQSSHIHNHDAHSTGVWVYPDAQSPGVWALSSI